MGIQSIVLQRAVDNLCTSLGHDVSEYGINAVAVNNAVLMLSILCFVLRIAMLLESELVSFGTGSALDSSSVCIYLERLLRICIWL
jgi:hypothetical protein